MAMRPIYQPYTLERHVAQFLPNQQSASLIPSKLENPTLNGLNPTKDTRPNPPIQGKKPIQHQNRPYTTQTATDADGISPYAPGLRGALATRIRHFDPHVMASNILNRRVILDW